MKNKEKQLAILQQIESYLEECKESIKQENDCLPYFNNMGICILKLIQSQGGIKEVKGFRKNIDVLIN